MKKLVSLFITVLCISVSNEISAQVSLSANSIQPAPDSRITLISNETNSSVIAVELFGSETGTVTLPGGDKKIISLNTGSPILKKGFPDLPKLTTSVTIPDLGETEVEILSADYYDTPGFDIAPSKGTLTRDIDPSTVPYSYNEIYSENEFWPKSIAETRDPYILRDFRAQTVVIYPIHYNTATHILRIYTQIKIAVKQKPNSIGINPFFRVKKGLQKVQTDFDNVYKNQFLNYTQDSRYTPLLEQGNMLIICGSSYMNTILPFVYWKREKGIPVTLVDVASIGNTPAQIKAYVSSFYSSNGLTFLMLIGDDADVHTSATGAGDSDNDYGFIVGNDHYPDIFVGRFSANNTADLQTQIDRTLQYEKNPVPGSWFKTGIGIGSNLGDGIGYNGLPDWQHERNIRTELLNYTYNNVYELYDGNHGGADAAGDPATADLLAAWNAGASVLNYTGHGDVNQIVTTNFHSTDVVNLTNDNKLPMVWIVGCQVGNFKNQTCFAEACMRSTHNGNPVGSIATMMSTINQDWAEPMAAQVEFNNLLTDANAGSIRHTFGGISFNGLMFMNDVYGQTGYDMTDTWTCFGDPSILVPTDSPSAMVVSHAPTTVLGTTSFAVNCNTDGALVCLSIHHNILGTSYAGGGIAIINFPALASIDTILVTVTAYNKNTYTGNVYVLAPTGPYVIASSVIVHDASGNNNSQADYGENISLETTLNNIGISVANAVSATITSADPYVTITNGTCGSFGNMAASTMANNSNAFAVTVAGNAPDGHLALFSLTIQDNSGDTWDSYFTVPLLAPVFSNTALISVNDATGNNNGRIDAGETVNLIIHTQNTGHSTSPAATATITCTSPYITINNSSSNVGVVQIDSNGVAVFSVAADAATPHGTLVTFNYNISGGAYSDQRLIPQHVSIIIEDWENGLGNFGWTMTGNANWFITTTQPYDGADCLQSGAIGDNQSTTVALTVDQTAADSIVFYKRVDSESGYDYLTFYINNIGQNQWSGNIDWSREVFYSNNIGNVTFKWTYSKDQSTSAGADAAWIDDVILPQSTVATVITETSPEDFSVSASPNPAHTNTTIQYVLKKDVPVQIALYNMLGEKVADLENTEKQSAGKHNVNLDCSGFAAGMYQCVLNLGGEIFREKIIVQ